MIGQHLSDHLLRLVEMTGLRGGVDLLGSGIGICKRWQHGESRGRGKGCSN
jgi:hypothetical protein